MTTSSSPLQSTAVGRVPNAPLQKLWVMLGTSRLTPHAGARHDLTGRRRCPRPLANSVSRLVLGAAFRVRGRGWRRSRIPRPDIGPREIGQLGADDFRAQRNALVGGQLLLGAFLQMRGL